MPLSNKNRTGGEYRFVVVPATDSLTIVRHAAPARRHQQPSQKNNVGKGQQGTNVGTMPQREVIISKGHAVRRGTPQRRLTRRMAQTSTEFVRTAPQNRA